MSLVDGPFDPSVAPSWLDHVRADLWCPLIGGFPEEARAPSGAPPTRLVRLITEARLLWGVDVPPDWPGVVLAQPIDGLMAGPWTITHKPAPDLAARLLDVPLEHVLVARALHGAANLLQTAQVYAAWGGPAPVYRDEIWAPLSIDPAVLESVLLMAGQLPGCKGVRGSFVLAAQAIRYAALGLCDVLEGQALGRVQGAVHGGQKILGQTAEELAASLLAAAGRWRAQELGPDAHLGASRRESLRLFGQERADLQRKAREPAWAAWIAEAKRIWTERPDLSKSRVAALVKQRLKLLDEVGTIRKRI